MAVWADGTWEELENRHRAPQGAFSLSTEDTARLMSRPPLVLLHSHCHGSAEVSDADSLCQRASGWTWGIVAVTVNEYGEVYHVATPEYFGPLAPRPPLEGRTYLWGVRDCFTLLRDYYAEQGITLGDVLRIRTPAIYPASHWAHRYFDHWIKQLGFKEVARHERLPGDAVTMQVEGAMQANHCAIYMGEGKYMQQFTKRTSGIFQTDHEDRYLERTSARFYRLKAANAKSRSTRSVQGAAS